MISRGCEMTYIDPKNEHMVRKAAELITDMTMNGATPRELATAILYSKELIDCLDRIREIYDYYAINILEKKYQKKEVEVDDERYNS